MLLVGEFGCGAIGGGSGVSADATGCGQDRTHYLLSDSPAHFHIDYGKTTLVDAL